MVEKVGFTNCVFEKLCFLKTLFLYCFQQNTAFQKQKLSVEKNRKFMKNSGLFWDMANGVFWVCFFEVLILKGLFLVCLALFQVLKMLVFPSFLGFFWGGSLLVIWVWKV